MCAAALGGLGLNQPPPIKAGACFYFLVCFYSLLAFIFTIDAFLATVAEARKYDDCVVDDAWAAKTDLGESDEGEDDNPHTSEDGECGDADSASSHVSHVVLAAFRAASLKYAIILGGLTMFWLWPPFIERSTTKINKLIEDEGKLTAAQIRNSLVELYYLVYMTAIKRVNVPQAKQLSMAVFLTKN